MSVPAWKEEGYESYVDWQYGTYHGMAMPEESWSEFWERYSRDFPKHV